jgi:transcriptional regulator with GAF, ATPase, and Fis domain
VRELRNVVERAVILARGGALEFDLPVSNHAVPPGLPSPKAAGGPAQPKFLTEVELERFERDNLMLALEVANWKIRGPDGASELLGVKPTTLLSRITKWGLKKPEHGFP